VQEYVYFKEDIAKGDGQTLTLIAQDIAAMLDSGKYDETSKLAVVNVSPKPEAPTTKKEAPDSDSDDFFAAAERIALEEEERRKRQGKDIYNETAVVEPSGKDEAEYQKQVAEDKERNSESPDVGYIDKAEQAAADERADFEKDQREAEDESSAPNRQAELDAAKESGVPKAETREDDELPFRYDDDKEEVTDESVERVLERAQQNGVVVVRDASQLPEGHKARRAIEQGRHVSGWFEAKTGKAYVYAPEVRSVEDLMKTLRHEGVAHLGVRELLGRERFRELCNTVWSEVMTEKERAKYLAYVKQMSVDEFNALSDDERREIFGDAKT
jgi:hypothetical protein